MLGNRVVSFDQHGLERKRRPFKSVFLLLFEGQKPGTFLRHQTDRGATALDFSRIRCPLCKWQPKPAHRWFCAPCGHPEYFAEGCGMCWNTFSTRGRCPGCGHLWRWTACLNCAEWSLHLEWYKKESTKGE